MTQTPSQNPEVPNAVDPTSGRGKRVALILATLVLLLAAALIGLKLWPRAKADNIRAKVSRCIEQAADLNALAICADKAAEFGELDRFPGWGAEAARNEAQALASIAILAEAGLSKSAADPTSGAKDQNPLIIPPPLVTQLLTRAIGRWPTVLSDERALALWRSLGAPEAEKIPASPGLASLPTLRRAIIRSALRVGDLERALRVAVTATLTPPQLPAWNDNVEIAEAINEALLLCRDQRVFADQLLAPILDRMEGEARRARYRAACAIAAKDKKSAVAALEEALQKSSDQNERPAIIGELAAITVADEVSAGATKVAPNEATIKRVRALAEMAELATPPLRPGSARGKLMTVAAVLATGDAAAFDEITKQLNPIPEWIYSPPTTPEDLLSLDKMPPVQPDLLVAATESAKPGPLRDHLLLRLAVDFARLGALQNAQAAIALRTKSEIEKCDARKADCTDGEIAARHLSALIDVIDADGGIVPVDEARERAREAIRKANAIIKPLSEILNTAPGRLRDPTYPTLRGALLTTLSALAIRLDERQAANEYVRAAWPLLETFDARTDGVDLRRSYSQGGSGLRALLAVVVTLRGDPKELELVRRDLSRDRGISQREAWVADSAFDFADGIGDPLAQRLAMYGIGDGPAFASLTAARALIERRVPREVLKRRAVRSDAVPLDRRIWLSAQKLLRGERIDLTQTVLYRALPFEIADLLRL